MLAQQLRKHDWPIAMGPARLALSHAGLAVGLSDWPQRILVRSWCLWDVSEYRMGHAKRRIDYGTCGIGQGVCWIVRGRCRLASAHARSVRACRGWTIEHARLAIPHDRSTRACTGWAITHATSAMARIGLGASCIGHGAIGRSHDVCGLNMAHEFVKILNSQEVGE